MLANIPVEEVRVGDSILVGEMAYLVVETSGQVEGPTEQPEKRRGITYLKLKDTTGKHRTLRRVDGFVVCVHR